MRSLTAWRASLVGFALSAALFVGIGLAAFSRIAELTEASTAVEHTLRVRSDAEVILSLLKDAETGQRGFIITGAKAYLDPYNLAVATLPQRLDAFRRLTADNATQQTSLNALEGLIERKLAELRETVTMRGREGFSPTAERIAAGEGRRLMDAARGVVAAIVMEEDRLWAERQRTQEDRTQSVIATSVGGLGAAVVLLAAATLFMARAVKERERAQTDQRAAEAVTAAVQKSEEHLRVTIGSIGDAVIATDARGRVTRLNAVAEALTGWRLAEAAGRPLTEIFVIVNEQTRQAAENPVEKVLRDGQIAGLANHTVLVARNGREIPIDDSAAPIKALDGDMLGVVLVFRDITERRDSERALKIARERLAQFVETVPCILWEAWGEPDAADQRIDFVSSYVETMLGYSAEEWLGTPNFWLSIVHPDDKEAAARVAAEAFASGEPHLNRFRWLTKDGRTLAVETRASVIKDETGAPIGLRGVTVAVA